MRTVIHHPQAQISIEELPNGKRRVTVQLADPSLYSPCVSWETSYSHELIEMILTVKPPAWLCDEIRREEDPSYVQISLERSLLAYLPESSFAHKRLLDFGCGTGASTVILAKIFPTTQIIGCDRDSKLLAVAQLRARHYGLHNIEFSVSPSDVQLPPGLGMLDFIVMNAVYEHLLPHERHALLPQLWAMLRPGGILFINETPHRYYPVEFHTTKMPLINYLPDRLAYKIVRAFSRQVSPDESWESLLRNGVRGGTEREILRIIRRHTHDTPILLRPTRLGFRDRIDLWYGVSPSSWLPSVRLNLLRLAQKALLAITGVALVPALSLALRKSGETE